MAVENTFVKGLENLKKSRRDTLMEFGKKREK
jgi:hypothetical protein